MEIELTSARADGSFTWRAAGAREPKGVVTAALLPQGSKPGDVLRAEVEQEIDGIEVLSILASKTSSPLPELLEIKGSRGPVEGGVSSDLRRPLRDGDRGDRKPRRDGDKRGGRPSGPRPEGRGPRPEGAGGERRPRPAGATGPRPERPKREAPAPKPKPKRLVAGRTNRDALLEGLGEAERRIADQLMSGGINAVRQSLDAQKRALEAEGKEAVDQAPILTLADDLLPQIAAAEWRDYAEAAIGSANEIALRDLRAVVAKADSSTRDDETRLLASQLREALDTRVEAMKVNWVTELTAAIKDGRLVRALKISGQPPEPGSRFPEELAAELAAQAGAALSEETMPDRWQVVAEAVATSSVRRVVTPASPPKEVSDELKAAITKIASRVPAIAASLGIEVPASATKPSGARKPSGPPRQNVAKKPAGAIKRPAEAAANAPRVMIGGRAIPPPPRAASAVEQVEDVAGTPSNDVPVENVAPAVPASSDEANTSVASSEPVVDGVADEQDVVSTEAENS